MYGQALAPLADDLQYPEETDAQSWFVYVVRLREHFSPTARDRLMAHLQDEGIGCAPYFPAIHLQPHHREALGHAPGDFPVCERVSARTLALPFYGGLKSERVQHVADHLAAALPSLPQKP
jgi:perosamine synthetase